MDISPGDACTAESSPDGTTKKKGVTDIEKILEMDCRPGFHRRSHWPHFCNCLQKIQKMYVPLKKAAEEEKSEEAEQK